MSSKLESPKVWLYHKTRGTLVTNEDPAGRPCLLPILAKRLNRETILSVGRLDFDSEVCYFCVLFKMFFFFL